MKTVEILRAAKALIDSPEKWTTDAFARNGIGQKVGILEKNAICWCMSGAVLRAAYCAFSGGRPAFMVLEKVTGAVHISDWNDAPERTHAEVLEAFDKAISLAEAEL